MEPSRVLKNMAVGWILAFQACRLFWPAQLHTQKVGWLSPSFSLLLCFTSPTALTGSFDLTPFLCHSVRLPLSLRQFLSVCLCVFLHSVGLPVSMCQFLSIYVSVSVFFLGVCCLFHSGFFFWLFTTFFLSFLLWLLINCFSVFVSVSIPHSLIPHSPSLSLYSTPGPIPHHTLSFLHFPWCHKSPLVHISDDVHAKLWVSVWMCASTCACVYLH